MWQPGARSAVDLVHEEIVHRIWRENPDLVSPAAAARRSDAVLAGFAASRPPDALIADLRRPAVGQGFAWGRFGPRTGLRRAGEEPLWALVPPERKPGFFRRLLGSRP